MKLFLAAIFVALPYFGSTALVDDVLKTVDPVEDLAVDLTWLASVPTWYFPLWNSMTAYRVAQTALLKTSFSAAELSSSCITLSKDFTLTAYGKKVNIVVQPSDGRGISFFIPAKGLGGRFVFHKSDFKSYILGVTSWDDGQVTWGVMSSETKLDPAVEVEVRKYIASLGYLDQEIFVNDYSLCF